MGWALSLRCLRLSAARLEGAAAAVEAAGVEEAPRDAGGTVGEMRKMAGEAQGMASPFGVAEEDGDKVGHVPTNTANLPVAQG